MEKWEARGRVVTNNLRTGSKMTGPALDYYRVVKGVRDTLVMYSTGRPRIEYATSEPGAKPGEPYIIVADRVRLKGSDRLWAGGKVTIDRSDFSARGDSLRLDTGKAGDGTLIGGNPVMRGLGPDSFNLTGRRLDLKLDRRDLTYVIAKGNGHAVSKEWDLVADTIGLDVTNRRLEQTLAWGTRSGRMPRRRRTPCAPIRWRSILRVSSSRKSGIRHGLVGRHHRCSNQAARLDAR